MKMPPELIPVLQSIPQLGVAVLVIWLGFTMIARILREQTEAIDRNSLAILTAVMSFPDLSQKAIVELSRQKENLQHIEAIREEARRTASERQGLF